MHHLQSLRNQRSPSRLSRKNQQLQRQMQRQSYQAHRYSHDRRRSNPHFRPPQQQYHTSIPSFQEQPDNRVIPSLFQIQTMFQLNGFRMNNTITQTQLAQLFNNQRMKNNFQNEGPIEFDPDLFEEIWGQLQTLSDSSVKIQNVCEVMHDALEIFKRRISQIRGHQGVENKIRELKKLQLKQQQLISQLDLVDNDYNDHETQLRSQLQAIRRCISKVIAQIKQLQGDYENFTYEMDMLIMVIGQQFRAPVQTIQTKYYPQNMHSQQFQEKHRSGRLKMCFIMALICLLLQMVILTYRLGFIAITTLCFVFYLLFLGYYNDNTVKYIIPVLILSVMLDIGYVILALFTDYISHPIVFSNNAIAWYVILGLLGVSMILRLVLTVQLCGFIRVPRTIEYFEFWGEEIILHRRSKNLIKNQAHFIGNVMDAEQIGIGDRNNFGRKNGFAGRKNGFGGGINENDENLSKRHNDYDHSSDSSGDAHHDGIAQSDMNKRGEDNIYKDNAIKSSHMMDSGNSHKNRSSIERQMIMRRESQNA